MHIVINLYTLPFLIAFLFNLIFSLIIFLNNHRNPTNRILSVLMFVCALWNLGDAIYTVSSSAQFSMILARIICGMTPLVPCVYLHFVLTFPRKKEILNHKGVYVLLYAPAAVFFYLAWFTNRLVSGPAETFWAKHYFHYGPAAVYYLIFFIAAFLIAILLLASVLSGSPSKRERFQSKWFIIATVIPILAGISSNLVLPLAGAVVFPLAGPMTLITSFMIAYAMLRYRIMSTSLLSASEIIISMLPGIVIYLGTDQQIISANKRFFELMEYTPDELLGQPISSILADDSRRNGLPMQKWEEKTQLQSRQLKFKTKSGEMITVSFSGTIVTDETNDIVGLVGMGFPVKGNQ